MSNVAEFELYLSENKHYREYPEALDPTKPYKPELFGQEWSKSLQLPQGLKISNHYFLEAL